MRDGWPPTARTRSGRVPSDDGRHRASGWRLRGIGRFRTRTRAMANRPKVGPGRKSFAGSAEWARGWRTTRRHACLQRTSRAAVGTWRRKARRGPSSGSEQFVRRLRVPDPGAWWRSQPAKRSARERRIGAGRSEAWWEVPPVEARRTPRRGGRWVALDGLERAWGRTGRPTGRDAASPALRHFFLARRHPSPVGSRVRWGRPGRSREELFPATNVKAYLNIARPGRLQGQGTWGGGGTTRLRGHPLRHAVIPLRPPARRTVEVRRAPP